MPTTLLGLLLFLVLLLPGFAYTLRRERHVSSRSVSVFRESVSVAFVSVVADAAILAAFAVLRGVAPSATPDVGALVRDPSGYGRTHYAELIGWGAGLLLIATVLATVAAGPSPRRISRRIPLLRDRITGREHEAHMSAWTLLFTEHAGARIHLGCVLSDGSYISGKLLSYSRASEDVEDREITLSGPIRYRAPGETELTTIPDVGAAAVSARELVLLTVSYVKSGANE